MLLDRGPTEADQPGVCTKEGTSSTAPNRTTMVGPLAKTGVQLPGVDLILQTPENRDYAYSKLFVAARR